MGVFIIGAWQEILNGFDFDRLFDLLLSALPALLCITLHELAHGYAAYLLGDNTARYAGRLTLNPLKHLDMMGFFMLVVAHIGWAKPVPVNMRNFKNPRQGMALTALAGPGMNLLIAIVFLFLYGLALSLSSAARSTLWRFVLQLCFTTAHLSLGLCLFNLLPIPPLDGSKVLFSFLPDAAYHTLMRYERYGFILLYLLAFSGVTGSIVSRLLNAALNAMMPVAQLGADIGKLLVM